MKHESGKEPQAFIEHLVFSVSIVRMYMEWKSQKQWNASASRLFEYVGWRSAILKHNLDQISQTKRSTKIDPDGSRTSSFLC